VPPGLTSLGLPSLGLPGREPLLVLRLLLALSARHHLHVPASSPPAASSLVTWLQNLRLLLLPLPALPKPMLRQLLILPMGLPALLRSAFLPLPRSCSCATRARRMSASCWPREPWAARQERAPREKQGRGGCTGGRPRALHGRGAPAGPFLRVGTPRWAGLREVEWEFLAPPRGGAPGLPGGRPPVLVPCQGTGLLWRTRRLAPTRGFLCPEAFWASRLSSQGSHAAHRLHGRHAGWGAPLAPPGAVSQGRIRPLSPWAGTLPALPSPCHSGPCPCRARGEAPSARALLLAQRSLLPEWYWSARGRGGGVAEALAGGAREGTGVLPVPGRGPG